MNYVYLFISLSIVSITITTAQPVSLGIMAGPNITAGESGSFRPGFQIQSQVFYDFSAHFGLGSGLGIVRKRSHEDISILDQSGVSLENDGIVYHGSYLELLLQFSCKAHENLRFNLGPKLWYLISSKAEIKQFRTSGGLGFNQTDYGLGWSAIYQHRKFNTSLFFDYGFRDTNRSGKKFNNTLGLSFGYTLL